MNREAIGESAGPAERQLSGLSLVGVLAKLVAVSAVLYLAVFYLRLGYFLLLVWAVGAAAVYYWTASERASVAYPGIAALSIVLLYTGIQIQVFSLAQTQSDEVFTMRWSEKPAMHADMEPEIMFEFEAHPSNYVGFYSTQIRDSLVAAASQRVEVSFRVTRDLGCMRGFNATRIGDLTSWPTGSLAYSRAEGSTEPVWTDPWWCP